MLSIFEEAFRLIVKIEGRKDEAENKIAKLEKKQEELKKKMDIQKGWNTVEDMTANAAELFKTIMCPLKKNCPMDNSMRWPKSSALTTE